ncbi:hypothetical protein RRG08_027044 [Elysia crispata]|uniref:Uncharacterized protein n=1 Tax=Elysia crispata TaxID=231223 RepID=A0AAE0ZHG6_9GAST|nr:hypothetical protein RRG08_027044 [Elysia crispata]
MTTRLMFYGVKGDALAPDTLLVWEPLAERTLRRRLVHRLLLGEVDQQMRAEGGWHRSGDRVNAGNDRDRGLSRYIKLSARTEAVSPLPGNWNLRRLGSLRPVYSEDIRTLTSVMRSGADNKGWS